MAKDAILRRLQSLDADKSGFLSLGNVQKLFPMVPGDVLMPALCRSEACHVQYAKFVEWVFASGLTDRPPLQSNVHTPTSSVLATETHDPPESCMTCDMPKNLQTRGAAVEESKRQTALDVLNRGASCLDSPPSTLAEHKAWSASLLQPLLEAITILGPCQEAEDSFQKQVKPLAKTLQDNLLQCLLPNVIEGYRATHPDRYDFFNKLTDQDGVQQQIDLGVDPEGSDGQREQYIRWLGVEAKKSKKEFANMLHNVSLVINRESDAASVCRSLGIDAEVATSLSDEFPLNLHELKGGKGAKILEVVGPSEKDTKRMLDKARQASTWGGTTRQALTDPLRAKFISEDPFVLAFTCSLMQSMLHVSRIVNRMHHPNPQQPINVNTNVKLASGLLVEIQYAFSGIAALQEALHVTYELSRADTALEAAEVQVGDPPVIIAIGSTGNGKSAVCQAISGDDRFLSAGTVDSVTDWTEGAEAKWFGEQHESKLIVVDTPGLSDAGGDQLHIYDMVEKLRKRPNINLILLTINSEACRLDLPLLKLVQTIEEIFGGKFWNNVVLVFTRWYSDPYSIERRASSAQQKLSDWMIAFRQKMPSLSDELGKTTDLPAIFVDTGVISNPNVEVTEKEQTSQQFRKLKVLCMEKKPFDTSYITHDLLSRQMEAALDSVTRSYETALFTTIQRAQSADVVTSRMQLKTDMAMKRWLQIAHDTVDAKVVTDAIKQGPKIQIHAKELSGLKAHLLDILSMRETAASVIYDAILQSADIQIDAEPLKKRWLQIALESTDVFEIVQAILQCSDILVETESLKTHWLEVWETHFRGRPSSRTSVKEAMKQCSKIHADVELLKNRWLEICLNKESEDEIYEAFKECADIQADPEPFKTRWSDILLNSYDIHRIYRAIKTKSDIKPDMEPLKKHWVEVCLRKKREDEIYMAFNLCADIQADPEPFQARWLDILLSEHDTGYIHDAIRRRTDINPDMERLKKHWLKICLRREHPSEIYAAFNECSAIQVEPELLQNRWMQLLLTRYGADEIYEAIMTKPDINPNSELLKSRWLELSLQRHDVAFLHEAIKQAAKIHVPVEPLQELLESIRSFCVKPSVGSWLSDIPIRKTDYLTEYTIEVDKRGGSRLGVDVDNQDGKTLLVEEIHEGLIMEWNRLHPGQQVRPGDRVVEVNGIRDDLMRLVEECKQNIFLTIKFLTEHVVMVELPPLAKYDIEDPAELDDNLPEVTDEDGSSYRGQTLDDKRHGHGVWTSRTGNYEGQWMADMQHGEGRQTWSDGRVYSGQFDSGKFAGHGRMVWHTAKGLLSYEGQYEANLKHGVGKFTWSDGRTYDGQWCHGKRHGAGEYTNARGETKSGLWRAGKVSEWLTQSFGMVDQLDGLPSTRTKAYLFEEQVPSFKDVPAAVGNNVPTASAAVVKLGEASLLQARPEVKVEADARYTGQWCGEQRHGKGVLVRLDGQRYEGEFVNGRSHGHGIFSAPNGNTYEGQWQQDRAHGHGKYIHADGSSYEGEWYQDDKSGRGIEKWIDGAEYEGEFSHGSKHGVGTYKSGTGIVYEGQFRHDKMDGDGTYEFADGRKFIGQWQQGHMNGKGKTEWPNGCKHEGLYERDMKHGEGVFTYPDGREYRGQWRNGKQDGTVTTIDKNGVSTTCEWRKGERVGNKGSVG